jgi:nicotinamide riboside transporter PnuC
MPDSLMAGLWSGLLATSPLEALAVLSGIIYVVLAVPRSRWCWIAGGFSSLIYMWLSARARLPMQSLLQAWYVGVAVYGFLRWSREGSDRRFAVVVARPCRRYWRVAAAGCGHRAFPGRGNAGGLAPSGCVDHGAQPLRQLAHRPCQT